MYRQSYRQRDRIRTRVCCGNRVHAAGRLNEMPKTLTRDKEYCQWFTLRMVPATSFSRRKLRPGDAALWACPPEFGLVPAMGVPPSSAPAALRFCTFCLIETVFTRRNSHGSRTGNHRRNRQRTTQPAACDSSSLVQPTPTSRRTLPLLWRLRRSITETPSISSKWASRNFKNSTMTESSWTTTDDGIPTQSAS